MGVLQENIRASLKSLDTEETIDIYFYRPLGYLLASVAKKVSISPNSVTIVSILWGMLAGHLFYYNDITLTLIGILSLIFANMLDSADGQLARMTNNCTTLGRFLDGFAGNLWFVSIYIHLGLRLMNEGSPWTVFIAIVIVGVFHSLQASTADYYRTQHLFFIDKLKLSDLENLSEMKSNYDRLKWNENPIKKLYLRFFINYVNQQHLIAKTYNIFFSELIKRYGSRIPSDIKQRFRTLSKPLMKYTNILTINTRMIVLFIALLSNNIWLYLAFEATILNILLIYMIVRHEKLSKKMYKELIMEQ